MLNPNEPAALTIERPQGKSDFLLVCDHASRLIPRSLGTLGLDEVHLASHVAWDIGAAGVARRLSSLLDATLILQNYSRLVIDCNRPPGSATSIPVRSEYARVAGNEALTPDAARERAAAVFTPTLLVAVHSFTPVYLGKARPWHVGLMYRHDRRLGRALLEHLRADADLCVGDNEPYAISDTTDYTLPFHGEARRIAHVGIEIRQDLVAEETGQVAWAARLAQLLSRAASHI
jgi:predicted N-formylglutamate amidohydrolase